MPTLFNMDQNETVYGRFKHCARRTQFDFLALQWDIKHVDQK